MGCPDWPKCFGLLIPPTNEKQVEWNKNQQYSKGIILRYKGELIVAKDDFVQKMNLTITIGTHIQSTIILNLMQLKHGLNF